MSEYPTREEYPDIPWAIFSAGRVSFAEAQRNMLAAFGYTEPYQPPPAYESMLLTAGYAAEVRCEKEIEK